MSVAGFGHLKCVFHKVVQFTLHLPLQSACFSIPALTIPVVILFSNNVPNHLHLPTEHFQVGPHHLLAKIFSQPLFSLITFVSFLFFLFEIALFGTPNQTGSHCYSPVSLYHLSSHHVFSASVCARLFMCFTLLNP